MHTQRTAYQRTVATLLWLSITFAWLVSIFSVIQEMCLATACRDTVAFSFFGINLGWLGIAYFSMLLLLLWQRTRIVRLDWALAALVFAGVGAEFRLLWIQKYIIGGWCPLCVSICCALFCAAVLLVIEKKQGGNAEVADKINLPIWLVAMTVLAALGLAIAILGVKTLE